MKAKGQLRQERERRGWSQGKIAEELGVDRVTVGRWERGVSQPYPYYRKKLSALFGKTPQELGLLDKDEGTDSQAASASPPALPAQETLIYDPAIPFSLVRSDGLIGRTSLLETLKQRLFSRNQSSLTALHGLPGVGKTAVAITLTAEASVQTHFADGILWAGLGPHPNGIEILNHWATLLGIDPVTKGMLHDAAAWAQVVHNAIGQRRMLLIIDDAWQVEEVLLLLVGGAHCAYLVTTRFPLLAAQISEDAPFIVSELVEEDGLALLARFVSQMVEHESETASTLVRAVGGLPLALVLMGRYLHMQAFSGQPRRLRAAVESLQQTEQRLRLSSSASSLEHSAALSGELSWSLQSAIALSDQQLDEQARQALYALSIFPAKPNTFSEEAALAVCALPVEVLDTLSDAGLLESSGPERYMIHQTIADYAYIHLKESSAYCNFVEYTVRFLKLHEKDYDALEPEINNILAALHIAFERGMKVELVRGITACAPFLRAQGLYGPANFHLTRAYQAATALKDTVGKETLLGHLGDVAMRQGNYFQAEAYLQEGLSLARQSEHQEHINWLLTNLGRVAHFRGDYVQAEAHYNEGLLLARQIMDQEGIILLLSNLGSIACRRGDYAQAEAYYNEGLLLARQIMHQEDMSMLLTNLGAVARLRENYARAEAYYNEGLLLAQQIGHREYTSILLSNLGDVVALQKNYQQAEEYLHESLAVARQINLRWLVVSLLKELGDLSLQLQKLDEAAAVFHEALVELPEGNQELSAEVTYGLAQVALAHGNLVEAQRQAEISLSIFEGIGHQKANEVKQWLDKPP